MISGKEILIIALHTMPTERKALFGWQVSMEMRMYIWTPETVLVSSLIAVNLF